MLHIAVMALSEQTFSWHTSNDLIDAHLPASFESLESSLELSILFLSGKTSHGVMSVSDLVASISCYKNCLLIKLAEQATSKDTTRMSWLSGFQWVKLINPFKAMSILWQQPGKNANILRLKHVVHFLTFCIQKYLRIWASKGLSNVYMLFTKDAFFRVA